MLEGQDTLERRESGKAGKLEVAQAVDLTRSLYNKSLEERAFSYDQATSVINHAQMLEQREKERSFKEQLDSLFTKTELTPYEETKLTPEQLYSIAEELNIPRDYVEKALDARDCSPERVKLGLEKLHAFPTHDSINSGKKRFSQWLTQKLLDDLNAVFPEEEFYVKSKPFSILSPLSEAGCVYYAADTFTIKKRKKNAGRLDKVINFFSRSKSMASIEVSLIGDTLDLRINLQDPKFQIACEETLSSLGSVPIQDFIGGSIGSHYGFSPKIGYSYNP